MIPTCKPEIAMRWLIPFRVIFFFSLLEMYSFSFAIRALMNALVFWSRFDLK